MAINDGGFPPILAQKLYAQPSLFMPENLLCEARRQKRIQRSRIPEICVLPPDSDIVRSLLALGEAGFEEGWACSRRRTRRSEKPSRQSTRWAKGI